MYVVMICISCSSRVDQHRKTPWLDHPKATTPLRATPQGPPLHPPPKEETHPDKMGKTSPAKDRTLDLVKP
ncbi:hypothetical protein QVD17_27499 [Tagetes erecta]|uniref:Uncharacterized protein n=1 Tax=Tagetes erecta TaxID=13708 RepID=A0AAD8KBJ1_TARER|nr:hypothetical protein QVD17_27499 [Tagetes erecta]